MAAKPYKKPPGMWQSAYNAKPKPQPRPGSPEWWKAHGVTQNAYGTTIDSTPGPSASASSAADTSGGPPVDPALVAQQNAANLSIGLGDAWDTYKGGQIDAAFGNLDNPAADAVGNPYSQAALALKRYNEAQAGTN